MNQVYVPSSLTPIDLSGFEGEEWVQQTSDI
jgi:hypothetical protein